MPCPVLIWSMERPGSEGLTGEALKAVLEKEFGIVRPYDMTTQALSVPVA